MKLKKIEECSESKMTQRLYTDLLFVLESLLNPFERVKRLLKEFS
jgi:hypothetical protein